MKKLLIALTLVASGVQVVSAQKSAFTESPNNLFIRGKEMFGDDNYTGCINSLLEFRKLSKDAMLNAEADYMILSSQYHQGKADVDNKMKDYLEKYPATCHRDQLEFYIGSTHFVKKDWERAAYWFDQVDVDYLNNAEQADYSYRMAYASLQIGKTEEARQLFGLLSRISDKYSEPASYYLAYIDFQNENYDSAIPVFRKLKNSYEYRENATFFLMQSAYRQGDLDETISEGRDYAVKYPKSQNAPEVFRLLGSSYYQKGDMVQSVIHYERFLQYGVKAFPEDMYQLGAAYYQNKAYAQAITVLQDVTKAQGQLGQAAFMLIGQCYLKNGDDNNALMAFDNAARQSFDKTISEEALYNYVVLMAKGSTAAFGESISVFKRFLTEYSSSKYKDEVNNLFAATLLSTQDYSSALEAINSIKSPGIQILGAKQTILFQQGTERFINGNYTDASKNFMACIDLGNYNPEIRTEAYFWKGETSYRQGQYQDAIRNYSTYISQASPKQPNYPLAFYNLGYANYQIKNYNEALNNFKKYVNTEKDRQTPNYADALNRAGDCNLFSRNFAEAERYYTQAAKQNPSNADYAEFQKAFVLGLQRNYSQKVSVLNAMMSTYPNSQYYADALFEKSRALVMLSKDNEAIATLEKLQSDFPQSPVNQKAGVQLGQLYFNNNNPRKSIDAYKRVITNYPNTAEARMSIVSLEGVYKEINDIASYASYVNSLGTGVTITTSRQDSLTYLAAENLYMKGRKDQAKTSFLNYLKSYPKGSFAGDANFYLASMAVESKNNSDAVNYFKEVINFNNRKYIDDALIYVSGAEFDNKDYLNAYNTYTKLSQIGVKSDNREVGLIGMLRCAYLLKRDNEVIAAAARLIGNEKTSPEILGEARFYRGKSLLNLSRTDEAIKDLNTVANDSRTVYGAEAQYLIAEVYFKNRSYDKAEKQVLEFMKQGTPHQYWLARAIIVLSDVYNAKGDYFQSRQYLQSLQNSYKGKEADIKSMIQERLTSLENK